MDIKAGINTAILLAIIGLIISIWTGVRSIQSGRKLLYFRLRQQRISFGWRMIGFGVGLAGLIFFLGRFGEPMIYSIYEPSPTPSLTVTITLSPTITMTPTITLTPTITDTPSVSDTPTVTSTPFVPQAIATTFNSLVTPNPATVFSSLTFGREIDLKTYTLLDEGTVFSNPIKQIVALYSFDGMTTGVQWTVLWYRDGELVYHETAAWDDTTGGYGSVARVASPDQWLPGKYEVQIFVGQDWKSVGRFVVEGMPDTATPTRIPTATLADTATRVPPATPTITLTRPPNLTFTPTRTPGPTSTRLPTSTLMPTRTPRPSDTPWPSQTAPAP
jgi:hypothetical protein